MARIPEAELERLKHETDLVALVQAAGVALRRNGANLVGRCPLPHVRAKLAVYSKYWMSKSATWAIVERCSGSRSPSGSSPARSATREVDTHVAALRDSLQLGKFLQLAKAYWMDMPAPSSGVNGEAVATAIERLDGVFVDFLYSVEVATQCFNVQSIVPRPGLAELELPNLVSGLIDRLKVRGAR